MNILHHVKNRLAIACLLFSSTMWGLIWYPIRVLENAGMSAVWSSLVMYFAAGLFAVTLLWRHAHLLTKHAGDLLLLATAAGIANIAFLEALTKGEVMRVMLLFYLSPLWTVLLGRWWLNERLTVPAMVMLVIAMSGSMIMLWNVNMGWPWPHGLADWLALTASVAFSVNNVQTRKLASVPMGLKTGVVWWGVVIISLLVLLWQQSTLPDVSISVWAGAWLLGWLGIVAMTIAVLYGVASMPVYRSAVIMLFELVVAAIAAWLLTDEVMSLQEWLGGSLILLAAYGVAHTEMKNEQ
ncbi:MAG: DMT family transporter [Gammaproteobacteria bacterium]|nr:DMT family transporter [Gammaproteobacteria bacterium]MDH5592460.1 DMT family transporter [Gammaproteobacteria bacterium]